MFKALIRNPGMHIGAAVVASVCAMPAAHAESGEISSCLEDAATVRAWSDKELSNVVVQCSSESGSCFVKFDDLDDGRRVTRRSGPARASVRSTP